MLLIAGDIPGSEVRTARGDRARGWSARLGRRSSGNTFRLRSHSVSPLGGVGSRKIGPRLRLLGLCDCWGLNWGRSRRLGCYGWSSRRGGRRCSGPRFWSGRSGRGRCDDRTWAGRRKSRRCGLGSGFPNLCGGCNGFRAGGRRWCRLSGFWDNNWFRCWLAGWLSVQVLELDNGFDMVVVLWLGVIPIRVGRLRRRNRDLSWLILLWFLLFISEGLLLENAERVVVDIIATLLLGKEKGLDKLAPFLAIGERDLADDIDDDTTTYRGLGINAVDEDLAVFIFEFRDTLANFLGTASVRNNGGLGLRLLLPGRNKYPSPRPRYHEGASCSWYRSGATPQVYGSCECSTGE